ncbi:hypothetical protein LTR17_005628 [Elasticomyces elasticus]|nr:hypothetical protein LTR17_005628 [Elasticomyces elasticus]
MSIPAAPHLLGIPRELRNLIYDLTFVNVKISRQDDRTEMMQRIRDGWHPEAWLDRETHLPLLLISKQTHAEYTEHARITQGGPIFRLDLATSDLSKAVELRIFKHTAAMSVLKTIKLCKIRISWNQLLNFLVSSDANGLTSWFESARLASPSKMDRMQTDAVTPTKLMCRAIRVVLNHLRRTIHSAAEVKLFISRDHLGDSNRAESIKFLRRCFDVPTVLAMAEDRTMVWPLPGKLQVDCYCTTPLYVVRPTEEVDARRGGPKAPLTYSDGCLLWLLVPSTDPGAWEGFLPQLYATKTVR